MKRRDVVSVAVRILAFNFKTRLIERRMKMKSSRMKKSWFTILALMVLSTFTFPCFTLATPWTTAGSTGSIDESDLDEFTTTAFALRFKSGITGLIRARYNVTNPFDWEGVHDGNWNRLYVSYKDPGDFSRIRVYLRSLDLETGGLSRIVLFDSNDFPALDSVQLQSIYVNHKFDFESKAYYIEARLERTSASVSVQLYALKLDFYVY